VKRTVDGELERMKFERMIFGRYLLVGNGESDAFWRSLTPRRAMKRYAGNALVVLAGLLAIVGIWRLVTHLVEWWVLRD